MKKTVFALSLIGLCSLLTSIASAETDITLSGDTFYLSCPRELQGKAQWSATENAAELTCQLKPGRANWAYLNVKVPAGVIPAEAKSIQIKMQLVIPDNMTLSVAMEENGFSYELTGLKVESGEWGTLTLPLDKFQAAAWNRKADDNNKLDPDQCRTILIGIAGTPAAAAADKMNARILIKKITFLP